jgi:hypothetical protein
MTSRQFVDMIQRNVCEGGASGYVNSLKKPAGRAPHESLVRQSMFYNGLTLDQQRVLETIVRDAVAAGVFGLLCILDGVTLAEQGSPTDRLELYHIHGGERTLLNGPGSQYLHDLLDSG